MHYEQSEFKNLLGARIKALRKARKWTQLRMATDFGYHTSFWQQIEAGKNMSLGTLLRVANTFDISLEELIGGIPRRKGPGFGSKGFFQKDVDG
jgi:transcriptional regulator with XRE-family HTH domain